MTRLKEFDVLVIGGGINGAGIARDLSGRGLSVMLCEKNDLASATSSASTKLIHGGLRYLEHHDFHLVRAALKEREVLLKSAPHIIWPLSFILPHSKKQRPWWLIRLGLFIYDRLGGKISLPRSKSHFLAGTLLGQPLKLEFRRGFSYSDCWVEDTRLVVLAALDAAEKGAEVLTRTECKKLEHDPKEGGWLATLQDTDTDAKFKIRAKMVVNASGPWVSKTLDIAGFTEQKYKVRWVKGSHIVLPRLYKGDHAYILQNDDKRIVFVIPYEKKFSLVGTTDIDYKGDLDEVRVSLEEVEYLCDAVNKYFRHAIKPENVEWAYSGVRPLLDDGHDKASDITRDYVFDFEQEKSPPILSIYGGKLTTFRKLSEQVGDKVVEVLGRGGPAWTASAPLPGGEVPVNFATFLKTLKREYNWVPEVLVLRLARAYGARARNILRGAKKISDLGEALGDGVYETEIRYLINTEWAKTLEDILWRRSKLGLHISAATQDKIQKLLKKILKQQETAE